MAKLQTAYLVQLIKSLTRAEKRHFKLFVKRNQTSGDLLFLQLFDEIDKNKTYNEVLILKKLPHVKKQQLSNLKAHLYRQLLLSLRLLSRSDSADIQVRERIDYARILYNKGLYRQSLFVLDRAKEMALKGKYTVLLLEIVEFEKLIESQYVTHSIDTRAATLTEEALVLSQKVAREQQFSNLSLQLYGLYLKVGYVRNKKEALFVDEFFHSNLPAYKIHKLDFIEKLYLYQSYMWYHYMSQDFLMCFKYSRKWVDLFEETSGMKEQQTPFYLKGLHNLLSSLFYLSDYKRFMRVLSVLNSFELSDLNAKIANIEGLLVMFRYIHQINRHYMEGTFTAGLAIVPDLMAIINSNKYNWDSHRILVFYYKIASMYFGSGDNNQAIHYLNIIINQKNADFRQDIHCFARILNLIAHFELGNNQLVEYQVKSVYRFLIKMEDLHQVQREVLRFIRRLPNTPERTLQKAFKRLYKNLLIIKEDRFEHRPFLYFDIISWLESKIQGKSVQLVTQEKFKIAVKKSG